MAGSRVVQDHSTHVLEYVTEHTVLSIFLIFHFKVSNKIILNNSFIRKRYQTLINEGYNLRFCDTHNDTDRCISPDGYPSRLDTQTAMEKSNYTLLLAGDTPGSDRWSQAMAAGRQNIG